MSTGTSYHDLFKAEAGEYVLSKEDVANQVAKSAAEFIRNVGEAARLLTSSPAKELQWRLNAQLRGEDPGKPVNWRGL